MNNPKVIALKLYCNHYKLVDLPLCICSVICLQTLLQYIFSVSPICCRNKDITTPANNREENANLSDIWEWMFDLPCILCQI